MLFSKAGAKVLSIVAFGGPLASHCRFPGWRRTCAAAIPPLIALTSLTVEEALRAPEGQQQTAALAY